MHGYEFFNNLSLSSAQNFETQKREKKSYSFSNISPIRLRNPKSNLLNPKARNGDEGKTKNKTCTAHNMMLMEERIYYYFGKLYHFF